MCVSSVELSDPLQLGSAENHDRSEDQKMEASQDGAGRRRSEETQLAFMCVYQSTSARASKVNVRACVYVNRVDGFLYNGIVAISSLLCACNTSS